MPEHKPQAGQEADAARLRENFWLDLGPRSAYYGTGAYDTAAQNGDTSPDGRLHGWQGAEPGSNSTGQGGCGCGKGGAKPQKGGCGCGGRQNAKGAQSAAGHRATAGGSGSQDAGDIAFEPINIGPGVGPAAIPPTPPMPPIPVDAASDGGSAHMQK